MRQPSLSRRLVLPARSTRHIEPRYNYHCDGKAPAPSAALDHRGKRQGIGRGYWDRANRALFAVAVLPVLGSGSLFMTQCSEPATSGVPSVCWQKSQHSSCVCAFVIFSCSPGQMSNPTFTSAASSRPDDVGCGSRRPLAEEAGTPCLTAAGRSRLS